MKTYKLLALIGFGAALNAAWAQGTPWPDWYFGMGAYAVPGYNGVALGNYSFSSNESFAFGANAYAGWQRSLAIGYAAYAAEEAVAIGSYSSAHDGAIAVGYEANGYMCSIALGLSSTAQAFKAIALGMNSSAYQEASVSIGDRAWSTSFGGVALGRGNNSRTKANSLVASTPSSVDPIFMVGNASVNWDGSDAGRANALTMFRDGDMHVAGKVRVQPGGDIPMFSTVKPPGVSYP
jgi:hypothetical protein